MSSDCIILATPIYSWYCTPPMKALLDRMVYGMNMYYGEGKGPSLWAGKKMAIVTTCGYKPEKGADLFEEGIRRYCRHSQLQYMGMLAERHLGYQSAFMDETKAAHVAFTLGMMGIADDILICDKNEDKLCSERQDLMDAVQFMPHRVTYSIAGYEELGNCDVIVNCVGDITLVATGNRDDEMKFTAAQVADYIPKVMKGGFNGIFVNITNPCDVITYLIQKLSGLPKNQVLGTGTGLDTSRLVSAISQQTGIEQSSFTAFMMGEHGDSQMVP